MGRWWLWALASLVSIEAEAGLYCANPAKVSAEVRDCGDNEKFSEAAVLCLEKFEAALEVAKGGVVAGTTAAAKAAQSGQAGKQNNSRNDYNLSAAALDALIAQAEQAQKETGTFFDSVVWPEDFDEPQITKGDLDAFLNSDPCYSDNRNLISRVLEDFDNYLVQLRQARDTAKALESSTTGRESNLGSVGQKASQGGRPDSGSPAIKKKKSAKPSSTVTGVEEDAAKRGKK